MKTKRRRKTKVGLNVSQRKNHRYASFQLIRSKVCRSSDMKNITKISRVDYTLDWIIISEISGIVRAVVSSLDALTVIPLLAVFVSLPAAFRR